MASYPLINGNRFSFASVEIDVNGQTFKGFSEISYTQSLEPGEVRGTSPQLLGMTIGDLKAEGSIGLYVEEDSELMSTFGDGFLNVNFSIVVSFADRNSDIVTDTIVGARFKNGARSFSKGTDGLVVKRDFLAFYIIENGLKPLVDLLE